MYSKIQAKVIYKVDGYTIQHSGNISSSLIRREMCISVTLEAQYLSALVCLYLPHQVELKLCSSFMENSMSMSVHIIINFCFTTKVYDNTLSSVFVWPIYPSFTNMVYTFIHFSVTDTISLVYIYRRKNPDTERARYSFCVLLDKLIATISNQKNLFILLFERQKQSQKWYIVVSFSYYYGSRIENAIPYNFMVRPSIILFELSV